MSTYGVYIIEFLQENDYPDGENLHEILKLSLVNTIYRWADDLEDLKRHLKDFEKKDYRYLHISCHANETAMQLNGEEVPNAKIELIAKNLINNKRIFLSACKGANKDLASRLIISNGARSLLGIPSNLPFDKAALFWPTFYYLMNEMDSKKMTRKQIINTVRKCVQLFDIPVNYYCRIDKSKIYLQRLKIRREQVLNNKIRVTSK